MYVKDYYVYSRCEEGVVYCLYEMTKALKQPYFSPLCKIALRNPHRIPSAYTVAHDS